MISHVNGVSYFTKIMECIRSLGYEGFKERFHFIVAALLHRNTFLKLVRPVPGGPFERLMAERPRYVSLLTSPYIDARWSSATRVNRLIEHASAMRGPLGKYDFSVAQSLHLLDLGNFALPDYWMAFDKPLWFCYEGLITLNLFKGRLRFFSVTFSFYSDDADTGIIIGGIQGRKTDNILDQYREFTKMTHGLRPRDFLLEILRIVARVENIKHIVGVPDRFRYYRYGHFSRSNRPDLHLDYDNVWKDRGGLLTDAGIYKIPLISDRNLAQIPTKKRSMYRRRYDLLDKIEARIGDELQKATPVAASRMD